MGYHPGALQQALDAVTSAGGEIQEASEATRIPWTTLKRRYKEALRQGLTPGVTPPEPTSETALLKEQLRVAQTLLKTRSKAELNAETIRQQIIGLKDAVFEAEPPEWMVQVPKTSKSIPGVPTLFASDWHWGEVVDPRQIGGVNQFNLEIAHARTRLLVEHAVDLLRNHMVNPDYPGIVLALGGDMVSGDIHEELEVSNELPTMPTVVDLVGVLRWVVTTLRDEFGHVFVPCVTGNHGRNTKKMRAKGRHHTSFDWLIYTFLAMFFQGDPRVTFQIPDGPDARYDLFGHSYLLTHGDQFRGGDGVIGALGPIIRGDHRKRTRNMQIGMDYDTMILGHWHQWVALERLIVNGSLKGYDEYGFAQNFPFEPPRQGLWLTHPDHGITISMPVYVERKRHDRARKAAWVTAR